MRMNPQHEPQLMTTTGEKIDRTEEMIGGERGEEQIDLDTGQMAKRGHEEAFPSEAELSQMSKPERKRYREKRRRDRVNSSFDELRALLTKIDPQCSNRVDISQLELIDRSIVVIKGLLGEINRNREVLRHVTERQNNKVETDCHLSHGVPFVNPFENEGSHHSGSAPLAVSSILASQRQGDSGGMYPPSSGTLMLQRPFVHGNVDGDDQQDYVVPFAIGNTQQSSDYSRSHHAYEHHHSQVDPHRQNVWENFNPPEYQPPR